MHPCDPALCVETHLDPLQLAPAVGHGDQVLGSVLDPPERPAQLAGGRDDRRVLVSHPGLRSEPAADMGGHDAQVAVAETQAVAGHLHKTVGHLGGNVQGHLPGAGLLAGYGNYGVALHRHDGDPLVFQPGPDDRRRALEGVLAVGAALTVDHVGTELLELRRRPVCDCFLHVGHGRKRLVVHHHELSGVHCRGVGLAHHDGHGFADEPDLARGQRRTSAGLVQDHEAVERGHVEVGGREHRDHSRRGGRGRRVYSLDPGVGYGRADERHPGQVVQLDVADEGAAPGEEFGVLDPTNAGTK